MRALPPSRCRAAGFTMMELLVVIGVLAVLAGLIFPAVSAARRKAASTSTKAMIERLKLAAESYSADFGDFPPSSLSSVGVAGNGVNEGIESLIRCVTTRASQGPYLTDFDEKLLSNTDGDSLPKTDPVDSTIASKELFELADAWGNPLVYYHSRDYKGGAKLERYLLMNGERATCKPRPSDKTKSFPNPTTFVIWSVGPDGVNEDGQGDDVCSWK
jgi:prepilin-type N-terminal cleavage/methylation domain-containing protein